MYHIPYQPEIPISTQGPKNGRWYWSRSDMECVPDFDIYCYFYYIFEFRFHVETSFKWIATSSSAKMFWKDLIKDVIMGEIKGDEIWYQVNKKAKNNWICIYNTRWFPTHAQKLTVYTFTNVYDTMLRAEHHSHICTVTQVQGDPKYLILFWMPITVSRNQFKFSET